jgi:hypothetical protein
VHAPEEVPLWLPAPVRGYVLQAEELLAGFESDLALLRRLATDSRMRYVWPVLARREAADTALVEFFDCAWQRVRFPRSVTTRTERAALAVPGTQAAELLRSAKEYDLSVQMNPELAAALDRAAAYSEEVARREENADSPMVVQHHSADDVARAYVRVLGARTRELFGTPLRGSISLVASVALEQDVSLQQVRNWLRP